MIKLLIMAAAVIVVLNCADDGQTIGLVDCPTVDTLGDTIVYMGGDNKCLILP